MPWEAQLEGWGIITEYCVSVPEVTNFENGGGSGLCETLQPKQAIADELTGTLNERQPYESKQRPDVDKGEAGRYFRTLKPGFGNGLNMLVIRPDKYLHAAQSLCRPDPNIKFTPSLKATCCEMIRLSILWEIFIFLDVDWPRTVPYNIKIALGWCCGEEEYCSCDLGPDQKHIWAFRLRLMES
jgi:hypothetical protein